MNTMKTNRLSHSSTSKFQDCPKAFDFHYNHNLRGVNQSAALLFGSAIDASTGALLEGKTLEEAKEVFLENWLEAKVNGVLTKLPEFTKIVYANTDFDVDLLTSEDMDKLKLHRKVTDAHEALLEVKKSKDYFSWDGLEEDDKRFWNLANWLSLRRKGYLMLDAFQSKVMPMIEEVLGVQVKVELKNEDGDSVIGYADLVARMKGCAKPVVLDVKTSAREYDKDSVLVSPQLTLYVHDLSEKYEDTRHAGFIVLHKNVKKNKTKKCATCGSDGTGKKHRSCPEEVDGKRCDGEWENTVDPEVYVQVLIDEIPTQTENIVIENIDYINQAIKNGIFTRNLTSCIKPYGKCVFYNLCYRNSSEGLIKVDPDKVRR